MAVATRENVAELYVAFFGRAPDSTGLVYWVNDSGLNLEEISQSFFQQNETVEKYPVSFTNENFVRKIYFNLFNREPDSEGLAYWVAELDLYEESDGVMGIARDKMILAVVNGAQGDDATILDNKTATGLYFADAGLEYGDFYLNTITADTQSTEVLKDRVDVLLEAGSPELFIQLDESITADDLIDNDEVGMVIPVSGYVYSQVVGSKEIALRVNDKVFLATLEGSEFSADILGRELALDAAHVVDALFTVRDNEDNSYIAEDSEGYEVVDGDIVPPEVPFFDTPLAGDGMLHADEADRFSIGGTSESLSTIELKITDSLGGFLIAQTVTYTTGQWGISALDLTTLADGLLRVEVTSTDLEGNRSEIGKAAMLMDTVTPLQPVVTLVNDSGQSDSDKITHDPTLSVLPSDPFDKIEYSLDGRLWSEEQPIYEEDGTYTVFVRETDGVGNISLVKSVGFTLDRGVPDAPQIERITYDSGISSDDAVTNDSTLFFSGKAEENSEVEIFLDNASLGTVSVSSSGNWSMNYSQVILEDGTYVLTAKSIDIAGNVSDISSEFTVTVDTQIELESFSLKEEDDSGRFSDDAYTHVSTPSFWVVLNEGSSIGDSVELLWKQNSLLRPVVRQLTQEDLDNGGIFLKVFEGNLGLDGEKSMSVRISDVAGNTFVSAALLLQLDTGSPIAPSIALLNDTGVSDQDHISSDGLYEVQVSSSDNFLEYSLDGTVWQSNALQFLEEGDHLFYIREIDLAGNISPVVSFAFTLDFTVPTIPLLDAPIAGDGIVNAQEAKAFALSGQAENDSIIHVVLTDEQGESRHIETVTDVLGVWNVSEINITDLAMGTIDIEVSAIDRAGNSSAAQWSQMILNTVVPSAPQVSLAWDTGLSSSDYVTQESTLDVVLNDASHYAEYAVNGGTWSRDIPQYGSDGQYSVSVREVNAVGSFSESVTLDFVLDTTAPPSPIVIPVNDSGVSEDHYTNDPSLLVVPSEIEGVIEYIWEGVAWSDVPPSSQSGDGNYTIWVRERDLAGNISEISEVNFILDTVVNAPEIVLVNDSGTSGDLITNDSTIMVNANEVGSVLEYSADGTAWGTEMPEYTVDGEYVFYAREIDRAGNISDTSLLLFELDTQVPSLLSSPMISLTPAINLLIDEAGDAGLYINPTDAGTLIGGKLLLDIPNIDGNYGGEMLVFAQNETPLTATLVVKDTAGNLAENFLESVLLGTDVSDLMGETQTLESQIFFGFAGDDEMVSGGMIDYFHGGAGMDQFIFTSGSGNSTDIIDVISDFETGIDAIKTGYAYSDNPRNYTEINGSSFSELNVLINDAELSYFGQGERYALYYNVDMERNSGEAVSGYLLIDWGETPDGTVDQVIELIGVASAADFDTIDIIA